MKSLAFMTVLTTVGSTVPVIPLSIVVAPAAAANDTLNPPTVSSVSQTTLAGGPATVVTNAS
ncbi:MAG: hypothetical protein ACO3S5_12930, partial [Ilumatobacteraceae bacterium]